MNQTKMPPRYVINPVAQPHSLWTPEIYQTIIGYKNPSYLNNLWLGFAWPVLTLPYRLFQEVIAPAFHFRLQGAAIGLVFLPVSILWAALRAIEGKVVAIDITLDVACDAILLSPQQGMGAVFEGHYEVVMDTREFVYGCSPR